MGAVVQIPPITVFAVEVSFFPKLFLETKKPTKP